MNKEALKKELLAELKVMSLQAQEIKDPVVDILKNLSYIIDELDPTDPIFRKIQDYYLLTTTNKLVEEYIKHERTRDLCNSQAGPEIRKSLDTRPGLRRDLKQDPRQQPNRH